MAYCMRRAGARLALAGLLITAAALAHAAPCVVVLHGLGRTKLSMSLLAHRLEDAGFEVRNLGYPSRTGSASKLAAVVGEGIAACRRDGHRPVHFVTHSLGGILVRAYFQRDVLPDIGRVVMLAPPNHGSEIVDCERDAGWFRWLVGAAGLELGTGPASLPGRLAPLQLDIGVIAGTVSSDPWFSPILPGADDGKVSVASTRLAEMRDFLTLPVGHTFIVYSRDVADQTVAFLRDGAFTHVMMQR